MVKSLTEHTLKKSKIFKLNRGEKSMKKDYPRMTEKAKDGSPALITEVIFHELEKLQGQGKRRYYTDSDVLNIVIKYLAELEDKIENGTLAELPCKVGDTIYYIYDCENSCGKIVAREIDKGIVDGISHQEDGIWIHARYDSGLTYWHKEDDKDKTLFLTKAEAEAKLRELQGAER